MDATTMRAMVAYIAELRRDREYHRAIEHSTIDPKEESIHNRSKGHWSRDVGLGSNSTGQGRNNL